MTLTRKQLAISAAVLLVLGAGADHFVTPEKVRIETKTVTVEVEKKQESTQTDVNTDRDRHKETTTTEVIRPDGTKEVSTKTVEDTKASRHVDQTKAVETDTTKNESTTSSKEIVRGSSPMTLSGLVGLQLSVSNPVVYGAAVTKPIFGPITVGAFGLSTGLFGVSAGITF